MTNEHHRSCIWCSRCARKLKKGQTPTQKNVIEHESLHKCTHQKPGSLVVVVIAVGWSYQSLIGVVDHLTLEDVCASTQCLLQLESDVNLNLKLLLQQAILY